MSREDIPTESIIELTSRLVRIPSRSGIDDYRPIFNALGEWLTERSLDYQLLDDTTGGPVALVVDVGLADDGPCYLLNATIDTAEFGHEAAWSESPTSGQIADGWLYGRGSADSKTGVAIFCHLAAAVARSDKLSGRLLLLLDGDEHSGGFRGVRRLLETVDPKVIDGAMLGYPGMNKIGIGSRGFERAILEVHGEAAHSGSGNQRGVNAIERGARLVEAITTMDLATADDPAFGLPPVASVTGIVAGAGFSVVPDLAELRIDMRLTPRFTRERAREILERAVSAADREYPDCEDTRVEWLPGWPAYRLDDHAPVAAALAESAERVLGRAVPRAVVGPSNIGNYLFQSGIGATCGFGVRYRNVHGIDECVDLSTVPQVYEIYLRAVESLLRVGVRAPSRAVGELSAGG